MCRFSNEEISVDGEKGVVDLDEKICSGKVEVGVSNKTRRRGVGSCGYGRGGRRSWGRRRRWCGEGRHSIGSWKNSSY